MAAPAWPPVKELMAIRERLDELLAELPLSVGEGLGLPFGRSAHPAADLFETDEAWVVALDVPGVDPATLDVQLRGNLLRLTGGAARPDRPVHGWLRMERRTGTFLRELRVDDSLIGGEPTATAERGVLTVRLPKAPAARRRRVAIVEEEP